MDRGVCFGCCDLRYVNLQKANIPGIFVSGRTLREQRRRFFETADMLWGRLWYRPFPTGIYAPVAYALYESGGEYHDCVFDPCPLRAASQAVGAALVLVFACYYGIFVYSP